MKYNKQVYRSFALVLQFGINMLVPIFLCLFIGIGLDRLFHTSFLVIIFFFMGAAAGFRNIFIFAKQIYDSPSVRDEVKVRKSNYKLDRKDSDGTA